MFRRKEKPVADANEQTDPSPAPATPEDLEKRVTELEKRLGELDTKFTGRVNDVTKKVAENNSALIKRVGSAEADITTVKTSADNNAESIKAFDKRVDGLVHKAEEAAAGTTVLTKRMDNTEAWQSAFNTAFAEGIQSAKDFALEQGQAAKKYTDDRVKTVAAQRAADKAALETAIKTVAEAPVKPHKHAVNVYVEAVTADPTPGGGSA